MKKTCHGNKPLVMVDTDNDVTITSKQQGVGPGFDLILHRCLIVLTVLLGLEWIKPKLVLDTDTHCKSISMIR